MLRSFKQLANEPDAPLKPLAPNARDVVAWLHAAQVKLNDAQQAVVSTGTRMDAAWDAQASSRQRQKSKKRSRW